MTCRTSRTIRTTRATRMARDTDTAEHPTYL
jgi:hypothetical protein